MERLTNQGFIDKPSTIKNDELPSFMALYERLAEYEELELSPEEIKSLQAELDQWKRESISDKAKLGEYKILEGQGLLVKANNGDCGNCGLLSEFGGCSAFGYGKGTSEQCKAKFKELEGGVEE